MERQLHKEDAASVAPAMHSAISDDRTQLIIESLFAGRKIEAIKLYREQADVGLKESKDAVEKLETELRLSSRGHFAQKRGSGCAPVILLIVATFGRFALYLN